MPSAHPVHDFDFLFGAWNVAHHRLKERLAGSVEWDDFTGTCVVSSMLDGAGNVDDNVVHLPTGTYRAMAMRSFDPVSETWAIWWLDGRYPHVLDTPVRGRFRDGIGEFVAADTFNGHAIVVRFRWLDTHTTSPRWEQAFSTDDGVTWETNWEMTFTCSD